MCVFSVTINLGPTQISLSNHIPANATLNHKNSTSSSSYCLRFIVRSLAQWKATTLRRPPFHRNLSQTTNDFRLSLEYCRYRLLLRFSHRRSLVHPHLMISADLLSSHLLPRAFVRSAFSLGHAFHFDFFFFFAFTDNPF